MINEQKAGLRQSQATNERVADRMASVLSGIEQQPIPDRLKQAAKDLQKALDAKNAD